MSKIYNTDFQVLDFHGVDLSHVDFTYEHKIQCVKCAESGGDTSCDNFHVFGLDDNKEPLGANCFTCGFAVPSMKKERESGNKNQNKENSASTNNSIRSRVKRKPDDLDKLRLTPEQIKETEEGTTPTLPIKFRGLQRYNSIMEKIGVRWVIGSDSEGKDVVYNMLFPTYYFNGDSRELVGYRVRTNHDGENLVKQFRGYGYTGNEGTEFLGKSFSPNVKDTLIIVGGEVDLITTLGAMQDLMARYKAHSINVVSVINGEKSLSECIKNDYDWVVSHKKIILALDNDQAGHEAMDEALKILPTEQCYSANFGTYKDPNSYGLELDQLKSDIYWNAQPFDDFGYVGADELFDEGLRVLNQDKIELPDFLGDLKPYFTDGAIGRGEWVNIIAGTSTGKSTIIDAWKDAWIDLSPYKQAVNSFEASSGRYGIKEVSAMAGRNISHIAGKQARIDFYESLRAEYMNRVIGEDGRPKFFFVSNIPKSIEQFKKMLLRMVKVEGVGVVWIDPALSLKAICPSFKEFDDLLTWLDQVIRLEHNTTIITVQHTRKNLSGGKNASQGGELSEEDGEGTRMLISLATINIGIERNKESEDPVERNTTLLSLFKNRPDGVTGRHVAKLFYRFKANRLYPFSVACQNGFFENDVHLSVEDIQADGGYSLQNVTTDLEQNEATHVSQFVEDESPVEDW